MTTLLAYLSLTDSSFVATFANMITDPVFWLIVVIGCVVQATLNYFMEGK